MAENSGNFEHAAGRPDFLGRLGRQLRPRRFVAALELKQFETLSPDTPFRERPEPVRHPAVRGQGRETDRPRSRSQFWLNDARREHDIA